MFGIGALDALSRNRHKLTDMVRLLCAVFQMTPAENAHSASFGTVTAGDKINPSSVTHV
jgi:hypothetical protein